MPPNNDSATLNVGVKRSLLIWVGAATEQLHIWETVLAEHFALKWNSDTVGDPRTGRRVWSLDVHRHFLMVALDHMLMALDLASGKPRP